MESVDVDPAGIAIMVRKSEFLILKTDPLIAPAANILKQQILSVGGDCAVAREVPTGQALPTPVILMATRRQYERLIINLKQQCFGLDKLGTEIEGFLARISAPRKFHIGQQEYQTDQKTLIMGILNVTPDSFYDGGRHAEMSAAIETALEMEADGADLIDIGGESTRPGSDPIPAEVEIARLKPVLEQLQMRLKIPISIDTYKSAVAEWTLNNGALIINDISGLNFDSQMAGTIAKHNAGVILMHIKGTPKNMQADPHYTNLIDEIMKYLSDSVQKARTAGIDGSKIFIDPGIGFGKTAEDNYRIMRYLAEFQSLGLPILVGPSRKAFIGQVLNLPADERLEGTLAAVTAAVLNGADLVRVHDVKAAVRAVKIADAIKGKS